VKVPKDTRLDALRGLLSTAGGAQTAVSLAIAYMSAGKYVYRMVTDAETLSFSGKTTAAAVTTKQQ
jgi:hypothetical protein